MKVTGNILDIKNKRDDRHKGIELHIDKVEYITYKKDGKYFQPFNYIADLNTPIVITGDCLSRKENKHLEEGEYEFNVFDKVEDTYELNPDKELSLTMLYDFDDQSNILTSVHYAVTISNEEFTQIQKDRSKDKPAKKGKRGN